MHCQCHNEGLSKEGAAAATMNDRSKILSPIQTPTDELKILLSQLDTKIEHEFENSGRLHLLSLRMFALTKQKQKQKTAKQTPAGIAKALVKEMRRLRLNRRDSD